MQWTLDEPKLGDIIRVKTGGFYHYGIYVSDDEVIQFGLPFTDLRRNSNNVEVIATDIKNFLCGNFLEVGMPERKDGKPKKPNEIVENARKRLGEKGYHILYNNCEHFAFECTFGKKSSSQVDLVRQMWKNFPFVNVYIKKFPFATDRSAIYPKQRQDEIESCKSEKVQQEKYYSWKLLEYALMQSLGLDIKKVDFEKVDSKWKCKDCHFSITHCDNLVGVVIARNNVGVDIEKIDLERFSTFPKEKILTEDEMKGETDGKTLNRLWTVKEAAFKSGEERTFVPNKINSADYSFLTKKIKADESEYFLSVVSKDLSTIKFHTDKDILIN